MDKKVFMNRVFKNARYELTSEYGMRKNPVTGVYKLHDGEDYGVFRVPRIPMYSPVFGTVIKSTYSAVMGHYVTIKTVYGTVRMQHMACRNVSVGQEVIPGTLVGVCGKTGYSTGIHLHIAYYSLAGTTMTPTKYLGLYAETQAYRDALPSATISRGHGSKYDIIKWQRFLCWFGANVTVDGEFGADTEEKTKIFQKYVGLTADGSVGTLTRGKAREVRRA